MKPALGSAQPVPGRLRARSSGADGDRGLLGPPCGLRCGATGLWPGQGCHAGQLDAGAGCGRPSAGLGFPRIEISTTFLWRVSCPVQTRRACRFERSSSGVQCSAGPCTVSVGPSSAGSRGASGIVTRTQKRFRMPACGLVVSAMGLGSCGFSGCVRRRLCARKVRIRFDPVKPGCALPIDTRFKFGIWR